jgi:hypothetical protein
MEKKSERLLSVHQAEARTGRRASTWRKDILMRRIPYVKIGRQVRIPVEVVEALIHDGWMEPVKLEG